MNPIEEDKRQAAQMTERQRQKYLDEIGTAQYGPEAILVTGRDEIDGMDPTIVHEDDL